MIYPRPKLTIFAESAKAGEVVNYPDWARGWGVTLEQTNSKPPMEWMNDALKQLNTHSLYLLQNGGYEWDAGLEYPVGAKAQLNNLIYVSKVKNTNVNPASNPASWLVYGLHQSDISQLLDGTSKVKAASEDALRRVNVTAEKGVSDAKVAKDKADLVGIQANQNTQNITGKVSKSGDRMADTLEIDSRGGQAGLKILRGGNDVLLTSTPNSMAIAFGNGNIVHVENDTSGILRPSSIARGDSGWWKCGSTGMIYQWRSVSGSFNGGSAVSFPIPFPSACACAVPGDTSSPSSEVEYVQISSSTRTGFFPVTYTSVGAGTIGALSFKVFAIGY